MYELPSLSFRPNASLKIIRTLISKDIFLESGLTFIKLPLIVPQPSRSTMAEIYGTSIPGKDL